MNSDFTIHFLTAFLAGGTSAALAVTAVAPLERVKLLLQIQKGAANIAAGKEYKGIIDCFIRIPKEQGYASFWRGNMASVFRCFPYQALNFSLKDLFHQKMNKDSEVLWDRFANNLIAGGLAGACALSVIYPLDYARTRMALDVGKKEQRLFKSVRHCLTQTYKEYGITAIYRGYFFSVFGVFIYRALYFGLFDTIMECVRPEYKHSLMIEFPAAELSATLAGFISYPLDTVRRQMMLQNFKPRHLPYPAHLQCKSVKYRSTLDCWLKIYRSEGVKGFFHGGLTNVYRGTGGAITLVLYDNIQALVLGDHPLLANYIPMRQHHSWLHEKKSEGQTIKGDKRPCRFFRDGCTFCNF